VTTAAICAITGALIVLGHRAITDVPTIALALVTQALLWTWKKIPEPFVVLGAAVVGLIVYSLLHH
jgi:chromate transporter